MHVLRKVRKMLGAGLLMSWVIPTGVSALTPQQVVVVANRDHPRSLAIAKAYANRYGIPSAHIISLNGDPSWHASPAMISPGMARQKIIHPIIQALHQRSLRDTIKLWILSSDFPTAVEHNPAMSLQGFIFVGGQLPPSEIISQGNWISPLYTGQLPQQSAIRKASSIASPDSLAGQQIYPCVSLVHLGARGNTLQEAEAFFWRSYQTPSIQDLPWIFYQTENPRSACRAWQVNAAVERLRELGQPTKVVNQYPSAREQFLGLFVGSAEPPAHFTTIPSVAIVENLTSWGAQYERWQQTKTSDWIRMGARGAGGTVTEPRAIWTKFPTADLFVRYAEGYTLGDSFYQSIACPLQYHWVGDPLASLVNPQHGMRNDPATFFSPPHAVFQATPLSDTTEARSNRRITTFGAKSLPTSILPRVVKDKLQAGPGGWWPFTNDKGRDFVLFDKPLPLNQVGRFGFALSCQPQSSEVKGNCFAGYLLDYKDVRHYTYLGVNRQLSAVVLTLVEKGVHTTLHSFGIPQKEQGMQWIELQANPNGTSTISVMGHPVFKSDSTAWNIMGWAAARGSYVLSVPYLIEDPARTPAPDERAWLEPGPGGMALRMSAQDPRTLWSP